MRHLTLYRHDRYYASFPAAATLADGTVAVVFRRARDQRWFARALGLTDQTGLMSVDHVDSRSQHVLLRLDGRTLEPLAEPVVLPPDGEAADQDANLLTLPDGRLLLTGFSWYPLAPRLAEAVRAAGGPLVGTADDSGLFLFWGGYARLGDPQARTWTPHTFLPPLPGQSDLLAGVRPHHGGALRGRGVLLPDGGVLQAVYAGGTHGKRGSHLFRADPDGADGYAWRVVGPIAHDAAGMGCLVEPALLRTRNGRLLAFHRTAGMGDQMALSASPDDGRTWAPWRLTTVVGHPFDPLPLPDGRVFLAYGYRHAPYGIRARIYDPDTQQPEDGKEIVLRDDGPGPDLGYPWATVLADGRVLVVYYFAGEDGIRRIDATVMDAPI
ncbi:sialidase family protein [Nitrospirillum viridazoti]|uniref:Sialidase domain-containing protein n=1 Tax=Nitrospirillum viridazoti CBAmc TaxID=1441467 RepID=A0A248JPZ0_9PROT|nr:sialidase family protein [Nitrospirillum amazonense]ASG20659.1 hypothetical protein Y958_07460 [Nitrospirillum amazonense CBAmc]TWB34290.1 BNR repeat protein [Nitrospirillum amazonense]